MQQHPIDYTGWPEGPTFQTQMPPHCQDLIHPENLATGLHDGPPTRSSVLKPSSGGAEILLGSKRSGPTYPPAPMVSVPQQRWSQTPIALPATFYPPNQDPGDSASSFATAWPTPLSSHGPPGKETSTCPHLQTANSSKHPPSPPLPPYRGPFRHKRGPQGPKPQPTRPPGTGAPNPPGFAHRAPAPRHGNLSLLKPGTEPPISPAISP
ncbi:basic salivary proline-rich protein 1-like [Penaeus monodon]|uniref:basic salivary proline-rich protein 1-like n=1 Tax=Penaeus monodon TaxID=6687 RepID=UPI0018A747A5|nr:basic salivary proline-rich protein 1-like [Penaeus monodon]